MPGSQAPTTGPGNVSATSHPQRKEPGPKPDAAPRPLSLLAGELYGTAYKGAPAPTAGEPGAEPDGVAPTEPDAGPDTAGGAEGGVDESREAEPGAEGEPQEGGGEEGEPISSLAELAEHFDLDPEWAETLKIPVKVDGKTELVPLKDVAASYQIQQAAQNRLDEAKARAKTMAQDLTAQQEALQAQFAVAAGLIRAVEERLSKQAGSTDWDALRRDDPAEYSARRAEMNEEKERIDGLKRDAAQKYGLALQEGRAKLAVSMRENLQAEAKALLDKLPEWRDEKVAAAERAELIDYAVRQGFDQQDVLQVADHRVILILRKAKLYDAAQPGKDAARKKFAAVPRVLKPGAPKPPAEAGRRELQQARREHRRDGSIDSAFRVLKARRKG